LSLANPAVPPFPVSDHCDGARFFNPPLDSGPAPPRGLRQVAKWRLEGGRARWPQRIENSPFPPPPRGIEPGFAAITFIGHASFLLQMGGLAILTDPVFSERCSPVSWAGPRRVRAPGIALDDLPRVDLVLLSHNHYDHMDWPTLRRLHARDAPAIITTLGNAARLTRWGMPPISELDWWERTQHGAIEVTATPARHFSRRGLWDQNRSLWAGFMLSVAGKQLLFAGDSGAGPHWSATRERLGAPGVALLPVGAYEPRWLMAPVHMNPDEAVQAHLDLGARQSIGMHFGTFQLTDEAVDAPVIGLATAAASRGVGTAFAVLGFGETTTLAL
jgi:L-ascorbate metabolism protein UlaG (beta-lactamase superfamily)